MIDKRTEKLLSKLAHICADGSYKIIEKADLGEKAELVAQMIGFLQDTGCIDIKYTDEKVYCMTVLPKGRATVEKKHSKEESAVLTKRTLLILAITCGVAAFVGTVVGTIVSNIF